jgi:hypothetical protein
VSSRGHGGATLEEVAAVLGISKAGALVLERRALRKLREAFERLERPRGVMRGQTKLNQTETTVGNRARATTLKRAV